MFMISCSKYYLYDSLYNKLTSKLDWLSSNVSHDSDRGNPQHYVKG